MQMNMPDWIEIKVDVEAKQRTEALASLVTLGLAELLERLTEEASLQYERAGDAGDSKTGWAAQLYVDAKVAHAVAASIREILEKGEEI